MFVAILIICFVLKRHRKHLENVCISNTHSGRGIGTLYSISIDIMRNVFHRFTIYYDLVILIIILTWSQPFFLPLFQTRNNNDLWTKKSSTNKNNLIFRHGSFHKRQKHWLRSVPYKIKKEKKNQIWTVIYQWGRKKNR